MRRLKLLPVTAILAFGLVGKITLLGDRVLSDIPFRIAIPVAVASGQPAEHANGDEKKGGGDEKGGHESNDAGGHGGEAKPKREAKACPPPPPPPEPSGPTFTEAELAVLKQLEQRRDQMAQRESDLQRRETLLTATESRIDEKVASLKDLQATLEGLIKQHDAEQENKLKSLVKIYETMKPADAARIFEQLDLDTLLPVVEKMKERNLAAILAKLDPMKARDVTVELKKLRELTPPPPT
jgi:Uncharacterized conserved protein